MFFIKTSKNIDPLEYKQPVNKKNQISVNKVKMR